MDSSGRATHFQTRCQPKDMRSFMRSYDSATLVKTPATRCVFSLSVTVSKPKCVLRSPRAEAPSARAIVVVDKARRARDVVWAPRDAEHGRREEAIARPAAVAARRAAMVADGWRPLRSRYEALRVLRAALPVFVRREGRPSSYGDTAKRKAEASREILGDDHANVWLVQGSGLGCGWGKGGRGACC